MQKQPDDLMTRARNGQAEALGELCDHYRNYLRVVVQGELRSKLRERVELSDVIQEVLVEIVRQFPNFTGESETALRGWMRRLVAQ
jgi:RNA polymerase sigma-70 factor (ECF subfamily)